jgi:hypothetical protein
VEEDEGFVVDAAPAEVVVPEAVDGEVAVFAVEGRLGGHGS